MLARLAYDRWRLGMFIAGVNDLPAWEEIDDSETVPWFAVAEEFDVAMLEARESQPDDSTFEFAITKPIPGYRALPGRKFRSKTPEKLPKPPTRLRVRRPTAADLLDSYAHVDEIRERLIFSCCEPVDGNLWRWDKFCEMELVDVGRLHLEIEKRWPTLQHRLYERWRRACAEIEAIDDVAGIHPLDVDAWIEFEQAREEPRDSVLAALRARADVDDDECERLEGAPSWIEAPTWTGSNSEIRDLWLRIAAALTVHDGTFHPITPGAQPLAPKFPTRMKDAMVARKVSGLGDDVMYLAMGLSRCGLSLDSIGKWAAEDAERLMHAAYTWQTGEPEGNVEGEMAPSASGGASAKQ